MMRWSIPKALRDGLDIKVAASAALFAITVLWGASSQWNHFNEHLASIDSNFEAQALAIEKSNGVLSQRIASLEAFKVEEEKRSAQDEKEMAMFGEQMKGLREDVSDLKGMMQTLILHEMKIDKKD